MTLKQSGIRLGLEVGGQKLKVIGLESGGEVVFMRDEPLRRGSYRAIVQAIVNLIQNSIQEWGEVASVGIAIPGTHVAVTGLVKNANITEFNGRPLWQDIESALGRKIRVANDANCVALAEATDGAAAGCAVVFGVILDAGCGGGLVAHGRVLGGHNGLTGEWGHNHLPNSQPTDLPELACYCGQFGCIETYVSAPGFAHDYQVMSGHSLSVKEIAEAAAAGEPSALAACVRFEDRLARGLAGVINIVDPDRIVIGGEMAALDRIYTHVPQRWGRYIFGNEVSTKLVPAQHGAASGVRGAAWLWDGPS